MDPNSKGIRRTFSAIIFLVLGDRSACLQMKIAVNFCSRFQMQNFFRAQYLLTYSSDFLVFAKGRTPLQKGKTLIYHTVSFGYGSKVLTS